MAGSLQPSRLRMESMAGVRKPSAAREEIIALPVALHKMRMEMIYAPARTGDLGFI